MPDIKFLKCPRCHAHFTSQSYLNHHQLEHHKKIELAIHELSSTQHVRRNWLVLLVIMALIIYLYFRYYR